MSSILLPLKTPFLLDLFNQLLPHLISRYYSFLLPPPNPYYLNCSPDIISKALSDSIEPINIYHQD